MTYQEEVIVAGITLFLKETRRIRGDFISKSLIYCSKYRDDEKRVLNVANTIKEVLESAKLDGNDQLGEVLEMYRGHKRLFDVISYISTCLAIIGVEVNCNEKTGKIELAETDQAEGEA